MNRKSSRQKCFKKTRPWQSVIPTHTLYVWCQIFLCPYRVLYSVQWDSANKHRLQCWRNCVLSLCFLPSFSSCLWCCWWEELGSLVEHPVSWFWLSSLSPWWPRCPVCLLWALWQKQVQQKMRWSLAAVLQCTVWDQFVLLSGWGQFFFFLPLVVFFIKGFSLGGMKALFRSSCFFVSASACFTWERGTVTVTFLEYHSYSSWVHLCSILQKLYSYRKTLILLLEFTCANQAINEWNCNQAIEEKKGDKCFLLAWRHLDFFTVRSVMSRHLSPSRRWIHSVLTLTSSIFFLFFTLSRRKNSPVASSLST